MVGFPWENKMEVDNTIKFMKEINPNYAWLAIVIPYPETKIYTDYSYKLKKLGKRIAWADFIHVNPRMAFLLNGDLAGKDRIKLLNYVRKKFDKHNCIQFLKRAQTNIIKTMIQQLSKRMKELGKP